MISENQVKTPRIDPEILKAKPEVMKLFPDKLGAAEKKRLTT